MQLKRESLCYEETAASRGQHRDEEFHITDVEFAFSAMLECSQCNDKVSFCGAGYYIPEYYPDEEGDYVAEYEKKFVPRYFCNPMKIFRPPRFCPEPVAANAERADAVRWIGNFGSHPEALTKDDVLDAYEILEVLLEDLYVGHHRSVRQIVEQINAAKEPRSRRKGT